jgi:phage shock protein A
MAAFLEGDAARAVELARSLFLLESQSPEIPAQLMLRAALSSRDPELIREAATDMLSLPPGGAWRRAQLMEARAALAYVDGRTDEAELGFAAVERALAELGVRYEAAEAAVCALEVLPHSTALRTAAAAHRPMLESLRARPLLDRLDAMLASEPSPAPHAAPTQATART